MQCSRTRSHARKLLRRLPLTVLTSNGSLRSRRTQRSTSITCCGKFKWLTVASPEGPADIELVLEPNANPAAKEFQEAIFKQGIPITAFEVDDLRAEHERLKGLGVMFTMQPTDHGPVMIAIFSDTCGNLVQLYQPRLGENTPG